MKDEDKTYENETVIDFKQAQTTDTINKLEQEIKDLKQERSDYYNVS